MLLSTVFYSSNTQKHPWMMFQGKQLSRSLIYLKFKSKQDLLSGHYVDFMENALRESEKVSKSKIPTKDKLVEISEINIVSSWERIIGQPMTRCYALCQKQIFSDFTPDWV
jgi:hypothetical protein